MTLRLVDLIKLVCNELWRYMAMDQNEKKRRGECVRALARVYV